MQKYKLVMLETPFVNGYAELEEQADRLVNDAINDMDAKGYDCTSIQLGGGQPGHSAGIYWIAVHFVTR